MDIILLNEVKRITNELKNTYDEMCTKSTKEDTEKQISLVHGVVKKNIEGLYKVKENILIKDNCQYSRCSQGLKPLIGNLFKLSIHFMREQDFNISLTEQRMKDGDREAYLRNKRFKNEIVTLNKESYDEKHDEIITKTINECIDKLINDAKNRYINSFGLFRDKEIANKVIEKEFFDSIKYMDAFLIMKDIIYENFDNYDILILAIENINYELIQLNVALEQAAEIKETLDACFDEAENESTNVYFVIMDGIGSSRTNSVEKIITDTTALNVAIAKNKNLQLLCKFKVYKQDEVHGYVLIKGNEKEFLDIVDKVYEPKMRVAFALRPYSEIYEHLNDIHDLVYNVPFGLYGAICSEARKNMQEKKYVILGGAKDNEQKQRFEESILELKNFVKEKYMNSNGDTKQIKSFMDHNDVILRYVEYLSKSEHIEERDYQRAVLAGILHDVSKFDSTLVKHGFEGAIIARNKLNEMGFDRETMNAVSNAIARHMGPIPGFMIGEAKKWESKTGEKIEFPRPENMVDKLLYDADMLSMIDKQGIEKMLYLRPIYQKDEDEAIAKENGISIEEAIWMSIFQIISEVQNSLYTSAAKVRAAELKNNTLKMYEKLKKKAIL